MKKFISVAFFSLSLVLGSNAYAAQAFMTGNNLYALLSNSDIASRDAADALGYISGVLDQAFDDKTLRICNEGKLARGQARQIVKNYMEKNPDKWSYVASMSVIFAMREAFPCR